MKSVRFALSVLLMSLSIAAFAQHEGHTQAAATTTAAPAVKSDAQKAFEQMKTLAGAWEGIVTTTPRMAVQELQARDPKLPSLDGKFRVLVRVASDGYALTHETGEAGPHVNPLTVFYVDEDRLLLMHYCAFGNRPRMVGTTSPDGKTVSFDFLDVTGKMNNGHMHQAVFTFVDADHHTEDWVFFMPGDKPVRAHAEMQRVK